MSPSTSGGIVSSMMVEYRADKCDDSESIGDSHLELGTRIICHDRPSFSRESFKLLGYGVCPVHPVHLRQRSKHTSWSYFLSVPSSRVFVIIFIYTCTETHLNNLIFIYSQYLLLRESRITPFKQSSFRYLTSVSDSSQTDKDLHQHQQVSRRLRNRHLQGRRHRRRLHI